MFHDGLDLPDFAAFPLLDSERGAGGAAPLLRAVPGPRRARSAPGSCWTRPTWRANLDWGARLGYDAVRLAAVNRRAVEFVASLAAEHPSVPTVVNGVIGPRGDGYVVGATMSAAEAAAYHGLQARAFAEAGAEMMCAITMTYAEEAIGVARPPPRSTCPPSSPSPWRPTAAAVGPDARRRHRPGRRRHRRAPAYYMVNCAHPTHFLDQLDVGATVGHAGQRLRANASRLSHAELDAATELDRGDIDELAALYADAAARSSTCASSAAAAAPTTSTSPPSPPRSGSSSTTDDRGGSRMTVRHDAPTIQAHAERIVELSLDAWAPVFASFKAVLGDDLYERVHPDWRTDQAASVRATLATQRHVGRRHRWRRRGLRQRRLRRRPSTPVRST